MKLDFEVSHLKNKQLTTKRNSPLIRFVKNRQKMMGLTNLQLVKLMGLANINKSLRRLTQFEQTGQLPDIYIEKICTVLGFDVADIKQLEKQHVDNKFADLYLFIRYFDQIWTHRKVIIRHRDYANIRFPGLYLSVAYFGTPNYNIGLLLQHYMRGQWLTDNVCCDRVYIIGVGGSPLSGNNTSHGFCRRCHSQKSFKLPAFGTILKAHKELKPACQQCATDKTLTDLINDFK